MSRRRFLGGLAAGLGLGLGGALAWSRLAEGSPLTVPETTTATLPPGTTTAPATTSSPTTTAAATTTSTTAATTTTATPADPTVSIPVICREAWGALEPIGDFVPHEIEHITVHHTAVLLEDNVEAPARARQHQAYHQSRGWPDLAYHFLIDAAGNVYEGRPIDAVGDTGTEYDPTGHFLVCCEGNFDEQDIPPAQYATLVQLVTWGCREFGVAPEAVRGHRDVASTSCPGNNLYSFIADGTLAGAVDPAVAYRLESVCGDAGAERVAAIEEGG